MDLFSIIGLILIGISFLIFVIWIIFPDLAMKGIMKYSINSFIIEAEKMGPIETKEKDRIFIAGDIDQARISKVIMKIKFLESDDRFSKIQIWLYSNGGEILAAQALCQVMEECKKPVEIVAYKAYSAAAIILVCGTKGRRFARSKSKFFIHNNTYPLSRTINIKIGLLSFTDYLNKIISKLLAEKTGQPFKKILKDCKKETHFTAQEALEYGLVDKII